MGNLKSVEFTLQKLQLAEYSVDSSIAEIDDSDGHLIVFDGMPTGPAQSLDRAGIDLVQRYHLELWQLDVTRSIGLSQFLPLAPVRKMCPPVASLVWRPKRLQAPWRGRPPKRRSSTRVMKQLTQVVGHPAAAEQSHPCHASCVGLFFR